MNIYLLCFILWYIIGFISCIFIQVIDEGIITVGDLLDIIFISVLGNIVLIWFLQDKWKDYKYKIIWKSKKYNKHF